MELVAFQVYSYLQLMQCQEFQRMRTVTDWTRKSPNKNWWKWWAIYLPLSFTLAITVGWLRCSVLTDFDIGVGLPLLADSVCVCVCYLTRISLMSRCSNNNHFDCKGERVEDWVEGSAKKMSPNRCVKTHQTASLRNSFRKPAQARKCLSSSSVTSVTSRRQSCQTGPN